jgi:hypothetical protein
MGLFLSYSYYVGTIPLVVPPLGGVSASVFRKLNCRFARGSELLRT